MIAAEETYKKASQLQLTSAYHTVWPCMLPCCIRIGAGTNARSLTADASEKAPADALWFQAECVPALDLAL
jgi:hypothetical protein